MATTFRMREKALEDLKARIDQSRALQVQAQSHLSNASTILGSGQTPQATTTALAELAAEAQAQTGDAIDKLQQLAASKLQAEALMLASYATAGTALWSVISSVDLSAGLSDPTTKQAILAAITAALS